MNDAGSSKGLIGRAPNRALGAARGELRRAQMIRMYETQRAGRGRERGDRNAIDDRNQFLFENPGTESS
jgi:hypothetical protein